MNILIVEDEPTSLKLAQAVLAAEGYSIHVVNSAEKALEMVKQVKPELVLLDLMLPEMHGLDLTRKLKNDPATKDIPIIAVTFYPSRFKREDALAAGCDAYIIKPLNTRELPGIVKEVITGEKNKGTKQAGE